MPRLLLPLTCAITHSHSQSSFISLNAEGGGMPLLHVLVTNITRYDSDIVVYVHTRSSATVYSVFAYMACI